MFFVFSTKQDGSFYYSSALYVPKGYKLTPSPSAVTDMQNKGILLDRDGEYYNLYTPSSTISGSSYNVIAKIEKDE